AGVTVSYSGGTPATSGTATTNGSGAYSVTGLQPGTYSVDYTPPSGFVNTGTKPLSVTLTAGQTATGKDFFAQQRNASIAGTVWNDANGNGSFDAGETGIAGVTVSYSGGTPATSGTATTNGSGAYSVTGLQPGTYSVDYTPPSGFVNTGTKPLSVTLTAGQAATGKDFFAQQRADLAVTKTAATNPV